jgi:hypothetical protein
MPQPAWYPRYFIIATEMTQDGLTLETSPRTHLRLLWRYSCTSMSDAKFHRFAKEAQAR